MQSVPITTDVVSSNLDQGEVYNILWSSLLVINLRQVCGFLRVLWFPPQKNWLPWYNWNIVESGVKHHQQTKQTLFMELTLYRTLYSVHAVMKTKNCKYTSLQLEMLLYVYDIDP